MSATILPFPAARAVDDKAARIEAKRARLVEILGPDAGESLLQRIDAQLARPRAERVSNALAVLKGEFGGQRDELALRRLAERWAGD